MSFFAGLAFFLMGLRSFENQLKIVGKKSIKNLLEKYANNHRSAGLMGSLTAALFQSQTATILLAISFLGAGLIELGAVIAIIIGANIGTTFTPWLISLLGFKFSITTASVPILAIGGLIAVFFSKHKTIRSYALMAFGFGMAFFGLGMLKESAGIIAESVNLADYLDYPLMVYGLIGLIVTAIMQSSTAMNAITITALFAKAISFPIAASIALGAELGTTISALLGAWGDRRIKMQAALAQVMFNFITIVVCGIFLHWIIDFVSLLFDSETNAPIALAALITSYNIITAAIVIPHINRFTQWIQKKIPDSGLSVVRRTSYLDPKDVTNQTIQTLRRDVTFFYRLIIDFVDHVVGSTSTKRDTGRITHDSLENRINSYHDIKLWHDQLITFAWNIPQKQLTRANRSILKQLIDATTGMMTAAKYTKDIIVDLQDIRKSKTPFLVEQYEYIRTHTRTIHAKIYQYVIDRSSGIQGINEIIIHINQWNSHINKLRHLLGDASEMSDDIISNQMNVLHRLQDTHRQLIYALHDIGAHKTSNSDLLTIRQY